MSGQNVSWRFVSAQSIIVAALAALTLTSCSKDAGKPNPMHPTGLNSEQVASQVPTIRAQLDPNQPGLAKTNSGETLALHRVGNRSYVEVEAVILKDSFAAAVREGRTDAELGKVKAELSKAGAIVLSSHAEVGFISLIVPFNERDLLGALKNLKTESTLSFNPVFFDPNGLKAIKGYTAAGEGLALRNTARDTYEGFSGLARIKTQQFTQQVERDLGDGTRIDGSSVRLGVVDTGITFNHPAFNSPNTGKSRIIYMKDFTREGRVYFSPAATFSASENPESADLLKVTAQVIPTPKIPSLPAGDEFATLKDVSLRVSPELKALLLSDAGKNVRLGFFDESSLNSASEEVDLNQDGKTNSRLPLLFVPDASNEGGVVFFDSSGTGDFRVARRLRSWNSSGDAIDVFAERVGFDIQPDTLPSSDGKNVVKVMSASLVGFDPGNHGSHVAGIAAGATALVRGVAPEAQILMNRVCANNGGCSASRAIVDLALNGGAKIINMSLGGLSPFNDGYGTQETIINRLTTIKQVLFVISAGNSGPGRQTVGSPSTAKYSLSVGAAASRTLIQRQYQWAGRGDRNPATPGVEEDFMLFFSSRGPTAAGGFKPNVSAPGTELSAVQFNSAPGARGGMDVYWGTSMSAPTTAGAAALLLDAINKYNLKNPGATLKSDALTLRQVLISSARPFDVTTHDLTTGQKRVGQYTWIDQGTGMIDLPQAWALLKAMRNEPVRSPLFYNGKSIELEYSPLLSATNPNGHAYDGSRTFDPLGDGKRAPVFATGVYVDYYGDSSLASVSIQRSLPEDLASGPDAGALTRLLLSSSDDFELRTVVYGSDKEWLKAGVRNELGDTTCAQAESAPLTVVGRGVEVVVDADGKGRLDPFLASQLNICLDRKMIREELAPGDHGALIYAYRRFEDRVSKLPSFIVPVSMTVPHKTLGGRTGFEAQGKVKSFGLNRHYVTVPKGTRVLRIEMSVPAYKAGSQACAGLELMMLQGKNTLPATEGRAGMRIANCAMSGTPIDAKPLVITRTNPEPGVWDLHVFGRYQFSESPYTLKVDYLVAQSSVSRIEATRDNLKGQFKWTVSDYSIESTPDSATSSMELSGLVAASMGAVKAGAFVYVGSPIGQIRRYPPGVSSVEITTGGSPGNDIDLSILECPADMQNPDESLCTVTATSGGATDVERAVFTPSTSASYLVRVDGYEIKDAGRFVSVEKMSLSTERSPLGISGQYPEFTVGYSVTAEQIANSQILNHPYFTNGKYEALGSLNVRSDAGLTLESLPVLVKIK